LLQLVTSTTSRACPSDLVAHQSIGQYAQATGQSAQAAALHRTVPTSTNHQLAPGLRRCRSMRIRAPLWQLLPRRSSSVSSWTPLSADCPAAAKEGGLLHTGENGKALTTISRCVHRPTCRVR